MVMWLNVDEVTTDRLIKYRIHGKVYTFRVPKEEMYESTPFAYCITNKKWAWLYPKHVFFKDEYTVEAEKIKDFYKDRDKK